MLLSSTMYSDASMCLRRYQYRWVDELIKKPKDVGVALRRGIWIHKCLEEYHKGNDWMKALLGMEDWAVLHGVDQEKITEIFNETHDIMQGYIDYWAQHGGKWEVLAAEYPAIYDFGGGKIRATIDLIIRNSEGVWIVEHKSTAEIPPGSWRAIDPQTALQFWLCHMGGVYKPVGIIFNYLLTSAPGKTRWKGDGTLYANCTSTTSAAFDRAVSAHSNLVIDKPKMQPIATVDADRTALVNDSLFYRRFPVLRPEGNVQATMQDIVATLRDLKTAQEHNHYRRSFHVLTCRKFCTYSELCAHEYSIGKESSTLREELFMKDDGTRGEGR